MNNLFTSSKTSEWSTPDWLYKQLDDEFHFQLDAACTKENCKCKEGLYFNSLSDNALTKSWYGLKSLIDPHYELTSIFCNPPYNNLEEWILQGYRASKMGCTVVFLLPTTKTDQPFWHDIILKHASEIRFIKGRVKFGGSKSAAPFPSVIVVFRPDKIHWKLESMEKKK